MTSRCPRPGLGTRRRENENHPLISHRRHEATWAALAVLFAATPVRADFGGAFDHPAPLIAVGLAVAAAFLAGRWLGRRRNPPMTSSARR